MLLRDACGDGETEACAIGFRGKKWIEQALLNLRWNSFSVVLDLKNHCLADMLAQGNFCGATAKFDVTIFANAVGRILYEVDQNLAYLLRIYLKARLSRLDCEFNRVFLQLRFEQFANLTEKGGGRNGLALQWGGASKGEEITNDSFQATDLLSDEFAISIGGRP